MESVGELLVLWLCVAHSHKHCGDNRWRVRKISRLKGRTVGFSCYRAVGSRVDEVSECEAKARLCCDLCRRA